MAAPIENVCDSMIATVFQSFVSTEGNDRAGNTGIKHFLDVVQANELLSSPKSSSTVHDIVSHIHNCLGSSKLRGEGLLLLNVLVKQCNTTVFQQHALTWIKFLLQILQGHSTLPVYSACCQILGQIIIQSKNFSDLTRELTTSVLPQLIPLLIAAPIEVCQTALSCINQCIRIYPGPIGPFRNKIETVVLRQLDNGAVSEVVYDSFALLARCGPGGSGGIKHTEAWTQLCNQTLNSLENTLTQLYDGIETRFNLVETTECLNLSTIDSASDNRITSLVSRWQILSGCLQALLSVDMFSTVKVPVERVIQLICRCLAINTNIVMLRPTTERTLLGSYISDIHTVVLCILDHIIVLCKKNLVTQSSIIVNVLSQELTWTQSENLGFNKQYGYLRSSVYNVLVTWLKVLDSSAGIVTEESNLIKQILHDCSPFTETLQLTKTGNVSESSSSKKGKKRKGYAEISQGISTQRKLHPHANSQLVTAALDALYWIITTSASEMSAKKIQEVQGFVIQTLLSVQQSPDAPIPYSSPDCRRSLHRVLQSLILASHHIAPPPTQCAVNIFTVGIQDNNTEVSALCLEAMKICELIIHPRVPCLNGPVICKNLVHIGNTPETTNVPLLTGAINGIEKTSNGLDNSTKTPVVDSNNIVNRTDIQKSNDTLKRKRPEDDSETNIDNSGDGKQFKKSMNEINRIDTVENVSNVEKDHDKEMDGDLEESEIDQKSSEKIDDDDNDDDAESDDDEDDDNVGVKIIDKSSTEKVEPDNNNDKDGQAKVTDTVGERADVEIISSGDEEGLIAKPAVDAGDDVQDAAKEQSVEVENILTTFIDAGPDSD